MSAQIALLPGNRLHLQHGPIDLVIAAEGELDSVARAHMQAAAIFPNVLPELVAELPAPSPAGWWTRLGRTAMPSSPQWRRWRARWRSMCWRR